MGCCFSKGNKGPKKPKIPYDPNSSKAQVYQDNANSAVEDLIIEKNQIKENNDLKRRKRDEFVENFCNKNFNLNGTEPSNNIFMKNLNKKMIISKDIITVEEDFIIKVNLDNPNAYYNNFGMNLDADSNDMISKEIYIDDIKVDDSSFEVRGSSIRLQFDKTSNNQTRKVRIIQKIRNQFDDYSSQRLMLGPEGMAVKYLIYLDDDLNLDDVSNKNYTVNKELNLAYFEGITTKETEYSHGFINYSKKIDFIIYKYIPELSKDTVQNIIRRKEANKAKGFNIIAKYIKIVITDYGQDIEEIILRKTSNYDSGEYLPGFSIGFYKDTRYEIDIAELNGKSHPYTKINDCIEFNNIKINNNQFMEIHLKYKYYTNEDKNIYRQENILLSFLNNSYCKSIIQIPDNYVVISTNDIYKQSADIKNTYYYQGIINEDKLSELFKLCLEKARWEIEYEYILEAQNNIKKCEFSMNKIFKGGNLKEIEYNINKDGANLIDSGDQYIFKYENLNTNQAKLNFKIKVENSTSNYYFDGNNEYLTEIPPEQTQFFSNLAGQIVNSDKTDFPDYKKIGKWVYNNIKYNIQLTGAKFTAMEIYKNKQGVCEHFTILYNTLLTAYGIDAIKCSGYAKDITEYNAKVKKRKDEENQNEDPTERHAWTLAKIDGEWVPLDATWNLFDKKVPITHVFENYGNGHEKIVYNSDNKVEFKRTKESVKYIKN